MTRDTLASEAKRLIDRIASEPRAAGSSAEAVARGYCGELLARSGFEVTEEDFAYSAFVGRWAVPLLGLLLFAWFVWVGAQARSNPQSAVGAGFLLLLSSGAVGYVIARIIPPGRRGTNLVAVRGGSPQLWLMAHIDSKSQPVPMLVRIAGIVVAAAAVTAALTAAFVLDESRTGPVFWRLVAVAGAAASVVLLLSVVGDRSQGALDNATGVAAALMVAAEVPAGQPLGVAITSAEELGLRGAGAWARRRSGAKARAINFDGIDDVGTLTCMAKGRSPLAARLRATAEKGGWRVRFRGVVPGILVDSVALNGAGWDAVTISRGDFSTLARIHTRGDNPDRLTGAGVAEAVEVVTNFIAREA